MARDTYKYRFYSANGEELHCGITNNLHRREGEHRRGWGEPDGYIEQVGRRTTRQAASTWERAQRCSPYGREDVFGFDFDEGEVGELEFGDRRGSNLNEIAAGVATGMAIFGGSVLVGALLSELFAERR